MKMKHKKVKHYECKECKKQYISYGWCRFHKKKLGHKKFKEINQKLKDKEF